MEEKKRQDADNIVVILKPNGDVIVVNVVDEDMTQEQGKMLAKIICVMHDPSVVLSAILSLEMFFRYITEIISAWYQRKSDD